MAVAKETIENLRQQTINSGPEVVADIQAVEECLQKTSFELNRA